jgi:putative membrane protein
VQKAGWKKNGLGRDLLGKPHKAFFMKKLSAFILACTSLLLLWSFMNKDRQGRLNAIEPDSIFILEAASSSMLEIQLGNIAQQKATNPRVKAYGAMMVRDHTLASQELAPIAARLNVTLPDTMLRKHARHLRHLDNLSGQAFDRAYINMMVEAHKDDIDEFEDASKKAADADVRAFATRQLPILRMHRDSATAIRKGGR